MRYSGLSIFEGAAEWLYYFHLNSMNKFIRTKEVLFSLHYMPMEIIIVSFPSLRKTETVSIAKFSYRFQIIQISI